MWLLVLLCLPILLHLYCSWKRAYWSRRGVFQVDGEPLFGSVRQVLFKTRSLQDVVAEMYNKYKEKKLIGFYSFYRPMLLVTDPQLVKQVMISDFNLFSGAGFDVDDKVDPLMGMNPFTTVDFDSWKERRSLHISQHTPAKVKSLPALMEKTCRGMQRWIEDHNGKPIKIKNLAELFTMDGALLSAYSIEPQAYSGEENAFVKHASDNFFDSGVELALISSLIYPSLQRLMNLRLLGKDCENFFMSLTSQLMGQREQNPSARGDIADALVNLRKKRRAEGKKPLPFEEEAAHMMAAYLDAFFTTGTVLRNFMLELTTHPEVQEEIRSEILEAGKEIGDFTYDVINSLKYLQFALQETIRLHPVLPILSRLCSRPARLGGVDVQPGTTLLLPAQCFHKDPDYFDDPEEYRPERFETKDDEHKTTFLPFGEGPRMCLGFRYGQLIVKLALINILLKYRMVPDEKRGPDTYFPPSNFLISSPDDEAVIIFEPL